eukprot:scaffold7493_cov58-Cyclotella_meneghiniana.AAC.3
MAPKSKINHQSINNVAYTLHRPLYSCLMQYIVVAFIALNQCLYTTHVSAFAPRLRLGLLRKSHIHSNINDDDKEEEWRAFRAKLVQQHYGLPTIEKSDRKTSNSLRYAHVTTPLVELGSILVSIPTRDLCQALDQQYWHRSIVLITQVSENVVTGSVEEVVPDDQLAQGEKRGRWSYRGLLMNRCTNLMLGEVDDDGNPTTTSLITEASNEWRIQMGGDLLGLDSASGTDFVCLHNLSTADPNVAAISKKLVGSICQVSTTDARQLCINYPERYNASDFLTYAGLCAWRPGQLEREMGDERNEWLSLSVDSQSIWDQLQIHRNELTDVERKDNSESQNIRTNNDDALGVGTKMWRNYLALIDMSESQATERIPSGQLHFYDLMLKVWTEEYAMNTKPAHPLSNIDDSSSRIKPGALVRAKSPPTSDLLLYDAEFIRSLILVIQDDAESTVGIILNHPMSAAVECTDDESALPLRYGGPIDVVSWRDGSYRDASSHADNDFEDYDDMIETDDEVYEGILDYDYENDVLMSDYESYNDDDDDSSFIWIHRDSELGGTQLGDSDLWLINEDDAIHALQSGLLHSEDVMVFAGVCIWEKREDLGVCGGGLREQIDALGSFEIVHGMPYNKPIMSVWDVLSEQHILTDTVLDMNINLAIEAWGACSSLQAQTSENHSRTMLSDAALKAWAAINLLEEPLDTLIIINDDHNVDNMI